MFRVLIFKPVFILLLLLPGFCNGQQLLYKFRQFTANDGLPSSEVHQVLRDSRNFMWFATDHGVCRYDGYSFETFNLPDNSILSLYEDSKKRIWAASFSGRLFYYENGKFSDYKYNDIIVRAIDQIAINRFYVDDSGNVYVSTTAPDCFVINSRGELRQLFEIQKNLTIEAIESRDKSFFAYISGFIMAKGVEFFPGTKLISFISVKGKEKTYNIKFQENIQGIKCGVKVFNQVNYLVYSGNYLFQIYPDQKFKVMKFENSILDINVTANGEILVATIKKGLYILNKNFDIIQNYFQGLTTTAIEKDYEGGIWVTTTQAGVFYLNSIQMRHLGKRGTIINDKILCVQNDYNSGIWAGDEGGTVIHFDNNNKLTQYEFPVISINSIYEKPSSEEVFVCVGDYSRGNTNNLHSYKHGQFKFIILQSISQMLISNKDIIAGKSGGLFSINPVEQKAKSLNKIFFRVSALFRDHKKDILVGNLLGLWKFSDGKLIAYDSAKSELKSRITDINEYKGLHLLLGTRGKGFLISLDDSLHYLTTKDGLASDNIRKIFVDENFIWLATNRGISRLSIQSLNPFRYSVQNISVQDGLLSNEVNDIKRLDTNIVVATNRGISIFNRNLYAQKQELPISLYITGVKINNLHTAISSNYDLHRSGRNFSISYVALSYRNSSNIEYRYRLLGLDSNWVYTSSRQIQFNPIPYGRFTVQIEARRLDEEWNFNNMASLSINCRAPIWMGLWFWVAAFLLAAALMLLFFINRTRKIRTRERERTALNKKLAEMELKTLRAQMNPHFVFNILNSIQYFIIHNENEQAQTYMTKFAKLLRLTLDNSRSTFITLADELSLLKLYIDLEKVRFEDQFDYNIEIKDMVNSNCIKIPNMLLQPYVENSIKHGFKGKQTKYFLNVSVSKKDDKIICTISDNGIGREKSFLMPDSEMDKHASTGTIIVQEKIEALKFYYNYDLSSNTEDLKDENGNAIGTRVTIIFPESFKLPDKV